MMMSVSHNLSRRLNRLGEHLGAKIYILGNAVARRDNTPPAGEKQYRVKVENERVDNWSGSKRVLHLRSTEVWVKSIRVASDVIFVPKVQEISC
jgi:hypothetical protein